MYYTLRLACMQLTDNHAVKALSNSHAHCILQSKSRQKQRSSHEASHNGARCRVSDPTGHPAAISACSAATEKLPAQRKVNFNRGRKRARSSRGGGQSSVKTSHTEEVQSNLFVLHSHTKAEVKIRYHSLSGWRWRD